VSTEMPREDVERLVRIETKLDQVLARSDEDRQAHEKAMAEVKQKHETLRSRVNSLENWRYAVGAALLMSSAGAIGAAINIAPK